MSTEDSIQAEIYEHLTLKNSFVKSMQITAKNGEVKVPRGYSLRLINCTISTLKGKECALHIIGGAADSIDIEDSIAYIDGIKLKDIKTKKCRVNLKKIPTELSGDDLSSSEMSVEGKVDFENTESFWHEVDWNSTQEIKLVNSRVEFYDCKIDVKSKITIEGSEVYFIKGDKCDFKQKLEIKNLDKETDSGSTNNIRGSAGTGPGSIVNFKKIKEVKFSGSATCNVTKSELNFFDIDKLESASKPIATYLEASHGTIADSKLKCESESCIIMKKSGDLHITNSEFESNSKECLMVEGDASSCVINAGKFKSGSKDCFSFKSGCFIEVYKVEKIESSKNAVYADNATMFFFGCKDVQAGENTFDLSNKSVLELYDCGKLKGKTIFKSALSSFLISGDKMTFDAQDKVFDGSGTFVINQDPPAKGGAGGTSCCS